MVMEQTSKRITVLSLLAIVLVVVVACRRSSEEKPPESVSPEPTQEVSKEVTSEATGTEPLVLVSGNLELPAANDFGEPGFHKVLTATQNLSSELGETAGLRLVLSLWDVKRSEITCTTEHPLSGCATIDWSDFESRPNVPPGGVFDNSLTLELVSGTHTFYLSETGDLNDEPDAYKPG